MLIKWTLHYMVKMWAVLGLVWMCSMLWKMYHCKCFKEFKWNFCGKTRWKIFLKPGAVLDTHSFHGSCFYDTGLDLSIDKKNPALKWFTLKFPIQQTMEKISSFPFSLFFSLWFHCPCREIRTHFLKCLFLALESINVFPQFWQMWGLSPVWILTCVFRWLDCLKFFPQKLQW